jgi:hypothetical protein
LRPLSEHHRAPRAFYFDPVVNHVRQGWFAAYFSEVLIEVNFALAQKQHILPRLGKPPVNGRAGIMSGQKRMGLA